MVVPGAAWTSVNGADSELRSESALLAPGAGAVDGAAVDGTGSEVARRNSCAKDTDAAVSKTAQVLMNCLVEVDIGLRQGCEDCELR